MNQTLPYQKVEKDNHQRVPVLQSTRPFNCSTSSSDKRSKLASACRSVGEWSIFLFLSGLLLQGMLLWSHDTTSLSFVVDFVDVFLVHMTVASTRI